MTRLRSSQFVALGITSISASCSPSPLESTPGEGEGAVRINTPVDERMARITLRAPGEVCMPEYAGRCEMQLSFTPRITINQTEIELDRQYRFAPGSYVLDVDGVQVPLQLELGPPRTLVLAAAQKQCEEPLGDPVSFGPQTVPTYAECPPLSHIEGGTLVAPTVKGAFRLWDNRNCTGDWLDLRSYQECNVINVHQAWRTAQLGGQFSGRCEALRWFADSTCQSWFYGLTSPTLLPPGTLGFRIGTAPALTTVRIDEGQVKHIRLPLPQTNALPPRWTLALNLRGVVEFPTTSAGTMTITSECTNNYIMPDTYETGLGDQTTWELRAEQNPACNYVLSAGGRTMRLAQENTTLALHRLDVAYPKVTREDGSTYPATDAKFSIYHQGQRIMHRLPAETGLYVLPGQYEVVVEFRTQLGPQTVRHQVSF